MRVTPYSDFEDDSVERAKNTVIELTKGNAPANALDLFFSDNLEEIENGIKSLNSFSSKCWILSAIALYTLIYDKSMYRQSGLTWQEYSKASRERLGLDGRDITEQLSGARFFIKHRDALLRYGWDTSVPKQSLARGELALELSGNIDETIKHMINDTQKGFKEWYQSFKAIPVIPLQDRHPEIVIDKKEVYIGGIKAVQISDELPPNQRVQIENYIADIFHILKSGDVPAIVPVYDDKEARHMITLRDKYRQGL